MNYIPYLHKDSKSDFGVSFPDFPGCVTAGKSLDEASRKAPEALASVFVLYLLTHAEYDKGSWKQ